MDESLSSGNSAQVTSKNRRRVKRHRLDIPATLLAEHSGAAELRVKIVELSKHAISIRTTARLQSVGGFTIAGEVV
jgi:hypothetical protein